MTPIKILRWFCCFIFLYGCSDHKPVVIQPGIFTEDWPTALRAELVRNKYCALDQINGADPFKRKLTFKGGETLSMSGWIFSDADGATPDVYLQLVGPVLTYTAVTRTRMIRPDVNEHFQLDPSWKTGFDLQAIQNAEPGEYRIEILQSGAKGVAQCNTQAVIKIEAAPTKT